MGRLVICRLVGLLVVTLVCTSVGSGQQTVHYCLGYNVDCKPSNCSTHYPLPTQSFFYQLEKPAVTDVLCVSLDGKRLNMCGWDPTTLQTSSCAYQTQPQVTDSCPTGQLILTWDTFARRWFYRADLTPCTLVPIMVCSGPCPSTRGGR